jgi:hypothetical protein
VDAGARNEKFSAHAEPGVPMSGVLQTQIAAILAGIFLSRQPALPRAGPE